MSLPIDAICCSNAAPLSPTPASADESALTSAMLKLFVSENAAELYDFALTALAPLAAGFGPTVDGIAEPIDAVLDKTLGPPLR